MKINKFEDLDIWKLSLVITKEIYDLSSQPGFSKDFELKNQIRRAVISISSNIVEGFERNNNNEFIRFLKISKGSCGEVKNQLYIALTIKYMGQAEFDNINNKIDNLLNQIGKFITYLIDKRRKGEFINKNPLTR